MPPRKKRAVGKAGSSSAVTFDQNRFKTREHEQRFNNYLLGRPLVCERGFTLREGEFPEIQDYIRRRNWTVLCASPPAANTTMVREFYANAYVKFNEEHDEANKFKSYVRGKEIDFSPRVIDNFLGIGFPYPLECHYERRMYREQQLDDVLRDLCMESSAWELDSQGKPSHLKKASLKPIPRTWCTFVQSRLIPKLHRTEVDIEKAVLVHCIINGSQIDVGGLIASKIHEIAQAAFGSLGYSSLITQLCKKAGCHIEGDVLLQPERAITAAKINQDLKKSHGQQGRQAQQLSSTQSGPSRPRRSLTTAQRLEQLEEFQRLTICQNQYLIQAVQGLGVMMRQVAVEQGMGSDELDEMIVPDEDLLRPVDLEQEEVGEQEEENDED